MTDPRLEALRLAVAEPAAPYGPVRIENIKLTNYKFFHGEFDLAVNGKNLLVYGENGSGKSSVYRALEYLAKPRFGTIAKERNLFAEKGEPQIEISFSNGKQFIIDADLTEIPEAFGFLRGLSVFVPLLDYKKLLKVHYSPTGNGDTVNIYSMFREIYKDYPVEQGKTLSELTDFNRYFEALKTIANGDLLEEINKLIAFFDPKFNIHQFAFKVETTPDGRPEPLVSIDVEYWDNPIERYHLFLNEARLSALAIAIYFASIRRLLGALHSDSLKILALDDLLISLDMSNRMKLLEILKAEFGDFQILFFTHDKELFELYKSKMEWEAYELYLDESSAIPNVIKKKGSTPLEKAKELFARKELEACGNMLRKELERILKTFLSPAEQLDRHGEMLQTGAMVDKAISKSTGEIQSIFDNVKTYLAHILNPLSHADDRAIFSQEIKTAMADLEKLKMLLK